MLKKRPIQRLICLHLVGCIFFLSTHPTTANFCLMGPTVSVQNPMVSQQALTTKLLYFYRNSFNRSFTAHKTATFAATSMRLQPFSLQTISSIALLTFTFSVMVSSLFPDNPFLNQAAIFIPLGGSLFNLNRLTYFEDSVRRRIGTALIDRIYIDNPPAHTKLWRNWLKNLKTDPEQTLKFLAEEGQTLLETSQKTADGIIRTWPIQHLTPEEYQVRAIKLWKEPQPIADVIIVGGGPAGISAAMHCQAEGLKVVLVEAGFIAQSFSDARMGSTHLMRSNADGSLIRGGSPSYWQNQTLRTLLALFRESSQEALRFLRTHLQRPFSGLLNIYSSSPDLTNGDIAVARNELFQHLILQAKQLYENGVIVLENTKVTSHTQETTTENRSSGVHVLQTSEGHEIRGRKIIVATGLIGTDSEFSRPLPLFQSLTSVEIIGASSADADLKIAAAQLRALIDTGSLTSNILVPDALLGRPDITALTTNLTRSNEVIVVGSGQSAANAVIELLETNPALKITMLLSADLIRSQIQFPPTHTDPREIERGFTEASHAQQLMIELARFGTPITPHTFNLLEKYEREKQLTIKILGDHLDPSTFEIKPNGAGFSITVKGDKTEAAKRLVAQNYATLQTGTVTLLETNTPSFIVNATGYDRSQMLRNNLFVQSGALKIETSPYSPHYQQALFSIDGLTSTANPDIYMIGPISYGASFDGSIFGMTERAIRLAKHLSQRIPTLRKQLLNAFAFADTEKMKELLRNVSNIDFNLLGGRLVLHPVISSELREGDILLENNYWFPKVYRVEENYQRTGFRLVDIFEQFDPGIAVDENVANDHPKTYFRLFSSNDITFRQRHITLEEHNETHDLHLAILRAANQFDIELLNQLIYPFEGNREATQEILKFFPSSQQITQGRDIQDGDILLTLNEGRTEKIIFVSKGKEYYWDKKTQKVNHDYVSKDETYRWGIQKWRLINIQSVKNPWNSPSGLLVSILVLMISGWHQSPHPDFILSMSIPILMLTLLIDHYLFKIRTLPKKLPNIRLPEVAA